MMPPYSNLTDISEGMWWK